ncbi:MAG: cupin-like domain-containing protein [Colwellia sp.]|nr:cupin-like domain-containing protein [Colwellia sp.]
MEHVLPQIKAWHNVDLKRFKNEIVPLHQPAILKSLIKDWPVVQHSKESPNTLINYLKKFDKGLETNYLKADKKVKGRFFYNEGLNGLNFETQTANFIDVIEKINSADINEQYLYISNAPTNKYIPNFLKENSNDLLSHTLNPGIWIGNKITIAPHFDVPDNIACCISGKRRFTLFPPEQISNLYIGPIDNTPAGQPVSMVEVNKPDFVKFPRYKEAIKNALVAELEPGDAIYIPSLWWHNVESLDKFNVLLTYFHDATPKNYGSGFDCLIHGLMSIRNLPEGKRKAWQAYFNHYLFSDIGQSSAHIPQEKLGILGKHTPEISQGLKEIVVNSLMR